MANPNDEKRDLILRHLYDVHGKARGPQGVAEGIRDLQAAMKKEGIKQTEVNSNLDYLLQKGWVSVVEERKTFTTRGGTQQESVSRKYKISDVGIDRLEGASTYEMRDHYSDINITNIKGVTVVGSGNVVNTEFADLSELLDQIEEQIQKSSISEEEKLNAISDIGTIQTQLSKPTPNASIIEQAWKGVEVAVTAAGATELLTKVDPLIAALLGA